ncbi:MAG: DNA topoisomerase, partial [Nanoarchaeota archaeon]
MPKKPASPLSVETKEYLVFDPSDVKKTVEIAVKAKPAREDIEIIEKKGKVVRKKKTTAVKKEAPLLSKERDAAASKLGNYILIITEKPQAAAKIAAALSNGNDRKINSHSGVSHYELVRDGKKIVVACAVGHLFTVSQTSKGTNYPQFNIGWFPNFEVNKKDFTKKYYMVIKKLAGEASDIIIATDFDVEGEVIGYNIMRFIAKRTDAKRMKFSSLTSQELQESFDNVRPSIEWGQAIAGETRHFVDWLYGINLSRAIMQAIKSTGKFKLMSIGRVQGPALKLIVDKEKEIQQFKSSLYWQIFATISDGKNTLELKYVKDITKKDDLKKFDDLTGQKTLATTTKTKQILLPPVPFDLSSLQTEAYKFHSLTPAQTLATAQKLYLAGLISYPRTSSQKIPDAMKPLDILKKLKNHFEQTAHAIRTKPVEGNKTDPAHPAIIPTGNFSHLEGADKKLYELIVKRFIGCFCDNAELENKKVEINPSVGKFSARGMDILKKGWLSVYPAKMDETEIPDFTGEVSITNIKIEEKE